MKTSKELQKDLKALDAKRAIEENRIKELEAELKLLKTSACQQYGARLALVQQIEAAVKLEADLLLPKVRVVDPNGDVNLYVLRRVTVQQVHLSKPGTDTTRRFKKDGTELSSLGCLVIHPEDLANLLASPEV